MDHPRKAKIDRIPCPWLIAQFIDKDAEFLYVPVDQVFLIAEQEGAIAYDIPGEELRHVGDKCSSDAFLERYSAQMLANFYAASRSPSGLAYRPALYPGRS